ncbi:MAG TPA: DUF1800 domain-containing protein [Ramlibacter sp.]|nr:DUF1800 domain-containing protein [Ramlibacter sp.]
MIRAPAAKAFATMLIGVMALLAGCGTSPRATPPVARAALTPEEIAMVERLTWSADAATLQAAQSLGFEGYIRQQLRPGPAPLPDAAQAQIAAMTISQRPVLALAQELETQRRNDLAITDDEQKTRAQRARFAELIRLGNEAASRSLLRSLYSPNQLHEHMTWFWMNHFSVFLGKGNLRLLIGDYEEQAIRPHALGRFRDLLGAAVQHPAMLRYLDNEQNAATRINENLARELMELHTLGVDGGYSQKDVQELARILTGLSLNFGLNPNAPTRTPRGEVIRRGVFVFNPQRHDPGAKEFLGHRIEGRGLAEIDEALDLLARHPSTARFVSRKLAMFLVADDPPPALVERMAATFLARDGDIPATLQTLIESPEFRLSLGHKFKDPMHYLVSSVRLAHGDAPIANPLPLVIWLNRMGQPLYGRQTPDGYPLIEGAWNSPAQIANRFEFARALASGNLGLLRSGPEAAGERREPPPLQGESSRRVGEALGAQSRAALAQARTPQEWNLFLLSAPEVMYR